jgi:hypothetical protein
MDAEDEKITPKEIGLSEGAIDYYKSIGKEPYFIYDEIYNFYNGFAIVYKDGRGWNWIDTNGELLWKGEEWFDDAWEFYNGFARFILKGRGYNYINTNGELLWKEDEYEWFDDAWNFYEGFANVIYNGTEYMLNTNGELCDMDDNRVNLGLQESKSGVIRLTESDIHNLVIKTLKEYLLK